MGEVAPLHIVVTGAAGYLGRRIVDEATASGHQVTSIVRNGAGDVAQDLAASDACERLLQKVQSADVVIHAASELTSDWDLHQRSSLPATQTACDLAQRLGAHLVHISSIVVYDFETLAQGSILDETCPIETRAIGRDGYVRAKLAQEEIVAEVMPEASVLRVGAIYGPERVMNAHLGIGAGPVLLRLAASGQIPLAHVDLCAQMAVRAAETRSSGAVNVLDTDLPDRIRFITALGASGWPKLVLPLPWQFLSILGTFLAFWPARPGLLRRKVLHARMKPLGYSNALMRKELGEVNMPSFEVLMKRAMKHD